MNELMIALGKLAGAGVEYLNALKAESQARVVREDEWQKHRFETDLANHGKPTAAASPGSAELPTGSPKPAETAAAAPKKTRRTKEQIAADEAAAQTKATEEAAHASFIAQTQPQPAPAAQQPAPAAANPLGDFGPVAPAAAPAPTLPQQIAAAQAQTAALQQSTPAAQPPAAAPAAAPKPVTEDESKVNLSRSVAIYVKVTAGTGATEEKLDAARNVFRSYMTTTLKAAKVKDLTHDQRLAAIAWLDAETAKVGK